MTKASLEEAALSTKHTHTVNKSEMGQQVELLSNSTPHGLPPLARRALFYPALFTTVPNVLSGAWQTTGLANADRPRRYHIHTGAGYPTWGNQVLIHIGWCQLRAWAQNLESLELAEGHGYISKFLFQPLAAVHLTTNLAPWGRREKPDHLRPHGT